MTAIHVKPFRGEAPRISARLLGENQAQSALNCKITSGRLDPIKGLTLVHTSLAVALKTVFRYRFNSLDNWLAFSRVVDVVKSPTAQDSLGRFYFTGDGEPRMSTYVDAISGSGPYPTAFYVLGVTGPTIAPTLVVTAGSGTIESRAYVVTYKTPYGEESPPSPAVLVSGFANGSWDLSALPTAHPNSGTASAATTVVTGIVEVTLNTVRGLAVYEELNFSGVLGMTDLNGKFAITSVDTATNKVRVALTTVQAYTSGGAWARVAPHNTTGMTKVIYRTVGTGTDYKRVAEIAVATTSYSDILASTALGEGISTVDSFAPPKNMHSLVTLANGALAGLAGNQICFSEQYKPYSWPIANRYAFSGIGVATSPVNNSVIILTDTYPLIATATVPEAASVSKIPGDTLAPCVSKRSVVDGGNGCLFASHDGLYLASPSGVRNITEQLYRYDEWQALTPASFIGSYFDRRYYAMHDGLAGALGKIVMLDLIDPDSVVNFDERVDGLYPNPLDGKLYAIKGNKLYQWDGDGANRYLAFWYSKEYQFGSAINFTCAQVHAQFGDIVPVNTTVLAANIALMSTGYVGGEIASAEFGVYEVAGSGLLPVPVATAGSVQFTLLRDGLPVFSKQLSSKNPFKLPGGFKSEIYSYQISSTVPVHSVSIAQSKKELVQAST